MSPYDDIAEWYDGWVGEEVGQDPYFLLVQALLGEVVGQRICDLACGQGRVARHLTDLGAQVVGVDLSARLLAIGRRHEVTEPRGVGYVQDDAQSLASIADDAFAGVICNMALMDVPNLTPTIHNVGRILRPGGWFVFSILHPCYHTSRSGEIVSAEGTVRTVGSYFIEGHWRSDTRTGPPGKVGAFHRTLSTYLNTLIEEGLVLECFREARATGITAQVRPVWAEVPAVLAVCCRKPARIYWRSFHC